jgi:hypothetical protein
MENGKIPAFQTSIGMGNSEMKQMGLTKREYFAGLAMQGIMAQHTEMAANGASTMHHAGMDKSIAKEAVSIADALLEALSNP